MNPKKIKWSAQLHGVREVSLLGTANLHYWQQRLEEVQLSAIEKDGRAQVLIMAADAKYMGLRFRELSFSVLASSREMGAEVQGAYLVQAFNSRRLFAFCERALFATPYDYGNVHVSTADPSSIQLVLPRGMGFYVEMRSGVGGAPTRQPAHTGEGGWHGPVFLPTHQRRGREPKLFWARVYGQTESYPFDLDLDWYSVQQDPFPAIFASLSESHFTPKEWLIRKNATHAKSKTYHRAGHFER
jgi:hypothetical protein